MKKLLIAILLTLTCSVYSQDYYTITHTRMDYRSPDKDGELIPVRGYLSIKDKYIKVKIDDIEPLTLEVLYFIENVNNNDISGELYKAKDLESNQTLDVFFMKDTPIMTIITKSRIFHIIYER